MRKWLLVFLKILPRGTDQALGIQKYAMLPPLQERQCPAVASLCYEVSCIQSSVGMLSVAPKHAVTAVDAGGDSNHTKSLCFCAQGFLTLIPRSFMLQAHLFNRQAMHAVQRDGNHFSNASPSLPCPVEHDALIWEGAAGHSQRWQ